MVKNDDTAGKEHTQLEELHHHPTTLHQAAGLGPYPAIKGLYSLQ